MFIFNLSEVLWQTSNGYILLFVHVVSYYLKHNIWVNLYTVDSKWLYSLYWCMNVTSITTNRCPEFAQMTSPVWHMVGYIELLISSLHCQLSHLLLYSDVCCILLAVLHIIVVALSSQLFLLQK